jgi:hypothetical protein
MIGRHNPLPGLIATAKIPASLIATHPETEFAVTPTKQTTAVLSNRNKKTPPGGCQTTNRERKVSENDGTAIEEGESMALLADDAAEVICVGSSNEGLLQMDCRSNKGLRGDGGLGR